MGGGEAIVGTSYAHEHFEHHLDAPEARPWTTEAVDFIAEILRGEIEIETTFRGSSPVSVKHFNRDENGDRNLLSQTGFLIPTRLMFWRPKRTEIERVSFL